MFERDSVRNLFGSYFVSGAVLYFGETLFSRGTLGAFIRKPRDEELPVESGGGRETAPHGVGVGGFLMGPVSRSKRRSAMPRTE